MLERPIFKSHIRAERVEGQGVFLLSEARQLIVQGRLYELIMPHLDGRSVEDVCRQLSGQATPAQVFYAIRTLEQRGFLCEHDQRLPAESAAQWSIQNMEPARVAEQLTNTTVGLHGFGVDCGPVCCLLEELGVRISDQGDLSLVLTDSYLHQGLDAFNQQALQSGRSWLLVKPVGAVVWIGPLFRPGNTACWECLVQRLCANFPVLGYLDRLRNGDGLPATDFLQTPATRSAAAGLISNAVMNCVAHGGDWPHLEDHVHTIDLIGFRSQAHRLFKQTACAACGDAATSANTHPAPLVLESRKKTYTEDGGHRVLTPQQTLDKYSQHISPLCGAVTMVERMAAGDDSMQVFISGNNIARGPESLLNLKVGLRNCSAGKGINDLQAKASALCEGLERHCAVFRGDEPRRKASLNELGDEGIDPRTCMLFSERQYSDREKLNARGHSHNYIPRPFDPDCQLEWTPVWSLTRNTFRYLPTQFCYFDYPHDCAEDFTMSCSNGNSAGNTLEEAVLQGFFELVERDAVCTWWYNRVRVPGVDLDSFHEPYLHRLHTYLKSINRNLWALDLTNDLGIPAFAAGSRRTDDSDVQPQQILFGFGADMDPRIALLRAVTEMNQMLVPVMNSPQTINDEVTVDWLKNATMDNQPYLVPQDAPPSTPDTYPRTCTDDIREDILFCRNVVEQRGMEMLVLDQTRSEIGLPVVKVIVPGLRHFWERFAPGRLYYVPVTLGLLDTPRTEDELNPIPMFL